MFGKLSCADWQCCTSKSTGRKYFFNNRTNKSLWYDQALPEGWAWGQNSRNEKFWQHLASGHTLSRRPTENEPIPPTTSQHGKRPRDETVTASSHGGSSASQARGASTAPIRWPRPPDVAVASSEDMYMAYPEVKPPVPTSAMHHTFTDAHSLLLSQLMPYAQDAVLDLGCGTGGSSLALHGMIPPARSACRVYAVDFFDTEYATALANAVDEPATAEAFSSLPCDMLQAFQSTVWEARRKIKCLRAHAITAVQRLAYAGLYPQVVYIDGPRRKEDVKALLSAVIEKIAIEYGRSGRGNRTHIAGGGWQFPGVAAAVKEVASEMKLRVFVEQNMAWTFSGDCIAESRNETASAVAGLQTDEAREAAAAAAVEVQEEPHVWVAEVAKLILRSAPLSEIEQAVRPRVAYTPPDGGPVEPPAGGVSLVNAGGRDKRRLTILMHAAQADRLDVVQFLLQRAGADVNTAAEDSKYTALIVAVWKGLEDMTRLLLQAGASPHAQNRWGEDVLTVARKGRKYDCLKLLEAAAAGGKV